MDRIEAATPLPTRHKSLSYRQNRLSAGKSWLLKIHQGSVFISHNLWDQGPRQIQVWSLWGQQPWWNSGRWVAGKMGRGRNPGIIWVGLGGNITDIQHATAPGNDPGLQIPGRGGLPLYKEIDLRYLWEQNKLDFLYLPVPAGKASRRELVTCPKIPHSHPKPSLFLMLWHNLRERLLIWLKVILKSDLRWIHK